MKLEIKSVDELVTVIQVCAWAFVVFVVMMVFGGTVFSMLYSVIFVQQPINLHFHRNARVHPEFLLDALL